MQLQVIFGVQGIRVRDFSADSLPIGLVAGGTIGMPLIGKQRCNLGVNKGNSIECVVA